MKPQWTNLSSSIAEFNNRFDEMAQGVTDVRTTKALKKLADFWNKVIFLQNEFDKLVEPIASIEVKLAFLSPEFAATWKTYKEYLLEDHNAYIGSRREMIMMKRLKKFSLNNDQRATEMLEFFIANGYKGMFKPTEKQLTGEEPVKVEETHPEINTNKKVEQL